MRKFWLLNKLVVLICSLFPIFCLHGQEDVVLRHLSVDEVEEYFRDLEVVGSVLELGGAQPYSPPDRDGVMHSR